MKSRSLFPLVKSFLMLSLVTVADANQAVSEINGKIDSAYGNLNSSDGWISEGSASFPVADALGFQFDALYADVEDVDFTGIGGHFFWRDYKQGLLGVAFGGVFGDEVDSYEISIEGEYYQDWLTIGAKVGYAAIEYEDDVPFIETEEDGVFGLLYATLYTIEDLSLTVGIENRFDNSSARFDAEYELPVNGLSLFSRAMIADNDYDHLLFGIRYYFGGDKSLKKRHRHDDPRSVVQDILFGVGTYGAEYNKRGNNYIRANGGSGNFGSFGYIDELRIGNSPFDDNALIGGNAQP
ncbi:MAG: hypothetical protein AAF065_13165 [Verrucomicrobiota bacterium]